MAPSEQLKPSVLRQGRAEIRWEGEGSTNSQWPGPGRATPAEGSGQSVGCLCLRSFQPGPPDGRRKGPRLPGVADTSVAVPCVPGKDGIHTFLVPRGVGRQGPQVGTWQQTGLRCGLKTWVFM